MDDKLNALDKLIKKVETGTAKSADFGIVCQSLTILDSVISAYHGSLDAAYQLQNMLLADWEWTRRWGYMVVFKEGTGSFSAKSLTPARAWLLAVLRAYRSVQA